MRHIKQFTLAGWQKKVAAANGLHDQDLRRQQDTSKRKRKEKNRSDENRTVPDDTGTKTND